jgi:hypothetical protein
MSMASRWPPRYMSHRAVPSKCEIR